MLFHVAALCVLLQAPASTGAGQARGRGQFTPPTITEADYVIKDFRFASGETLPELRIHYRTLGTPRKNAQGVVTNAVLIMHGTGGTGGQFTGRGFAGELWPNHDLAHWSRLRARGWPTVSRVD